MDLVIGIDNEHFDDVTGELFVFDCLMFSHFLILMFLLIHSDGCRVNFYLCFWLKISFGAGPVSFQENVNRDSSYSSCSVKKFVEVLT